MSSSKLSRYLTAIVAVNLGLAIWHLYVLGQLHAEMTSVELARFGAALALVSMVVAILLWTRWRKAGGGLFLLLLAAGLVIGGYEHFVRAGADNVFTMAPGPLTYSFQASAVLILLVELIGIWACVRLLLAGGLHAR